MVQELARKSTLKIKVLQTLETELVKLTSNENSEAQITFSKEDLLKIVETAFPDDENLK